MWKTVTARNREKKLVCLHFNSYQCNEYNMIWWSSFGCLWCRVMTVVSVMAMVWFIPYSFISCAMPFHIVVVAQYYYYFLFFIFSFSFIFTYEFFIHTQIHHHHIGTMIFHLLSLYIHHKFIINEYSKWNWITTTVTATGIEKKNMWRQMYAHLYNTSICMFTSLDSSDHHFLFPHSHFKEQIPFYFLVSFYIKILIKIKNIYNIYIYSNILILSFFSWNQMSTRRMMTRASLVSRFGLVHSFVRVRLRRSLPFALFMSVWFSIHFTAKIYVKNILYDTRKIIIYSCMHTAI